MKEYLKLYGPMNGLVFLSVGLLFFLFNMILMEYEGTSMRILMFAPVPLMLTGSSLLLFPGVKLKRKEIHEKNLSFWSLSPMSHKLFWMLFGTIGIVFLILQLLSFLDVIELSFNSCFFSKYLGLGNCY